MEVKNSVTREELKKMLSGKDSEITVLKDRIEKMENERNQEWENDVKETEGHMKALEKKYQERTLALQQNMAYKDWVNMELAQKVELYERSRR